MVDTLIYLFLRLHFIRVCFLSLFVLLFCYCFVIKTSMNAAMVPMTAMRTQTVQTFLAPSIAAARKDIFGMEASVQVQKKNVQYLSRGIQFSKASLNGALHQIELEFRNVSF